MKKYIYGLIGATLMIITVSSCEKTEGPLYSLNDNKVSFFTTATSLVMEGGSVSVPVGRTTKNGESAVNLKLSAAGVGYTDVFKLEGPVKFANGEAKAYAKINYGDISKIDPSALSVTPAANNDISVGLAFPFQLTIDSADKSLSNLDKISIQASNIVGFKDAGTAELNSKDGWTGGIKNVKLQKADGVNVYKLISPYGVNNIAFMIKSDGKTVVFPNQLFTVDTDYGPVTLSNVVGSISGKVITLQVGGYTVSAGSFGSGIERITLP